MGQVSFTRWFPELFIVYDTDPRTDLGALHLPVRTVLRGNVVS